MGKTLREGAERLHTVVSNAPAFIWSLDKNGIFTLSEGRGLKARGLRSGEVVGKSVFEVYRDVPNFIEDNRRALAGESFVSVVEVGHLVFESHYSPTRDKNGEVVGMIGVCTDITGQRDEEEKMAKIFDGLNIPAFAINVEHKITHWNTAVESLTGVKREAVVGTDKQWMAFYANKRPVMADLIVDEAPESKFKDFYGDKYTKSSLIAGAYEASDFFPAIGPVAEEKWLIFTAAPLKDSEGRVVGAIETLQDITEQKQMVDALIDSEAKYRALVESTEDSVYLVDRNCRYIFINEKHLARIGLPKNQTIGKIYGELHSDDETEEFAKIVDDVFETGNSIQHEHKSSRDSRYILRTLSPVKDSDGRTIAVTVVSKDITKLKQTEDQLRESEEEYRSLVECTEDSVYLVDRNCRYIFINEKHLARIGLPKNQTIGKIYGELHSEDEAEEFAKIVDDVFETGNSIQHEHKSSRDSRYILRTLSPVKDSEGRTIAVTVVSKDITERKTAEEERESLLKELGAKNRELEWFTYTVSHDLRSPLITIQGFTNMLRKDVEQNSIENVENDLQFIENAATKMNRLLNDTLQLSRIGRVTNPPEDVPFRAIVEDALEQTAEQIKSSGVEISVAEDLPTVNVDRMRIAEVLVNLIVNSINYRGDQQHPKIEIGYRIVDIEPVFFVKDNGVGIDKSQHEKVFELFYREDENSHQGTGAGLAIVKRIIEVHNGRIWIESEKGKGCTVCFMLPVT